MFNLLDLIFALSAGEMSKKWKIAIGVTASVALLSLSIMLILILRNPKAASRTSVSDRTLSNALHTENMRGNIKPILEKENIYCNL